MAEITLKSTLACPECGLEKSEQMPENACQYFWQCPECERIIKPKKGDCCVYCSYGDVPCPPVQKDRKCC